MYINGKKTVTLIAGSMLAGYLSGITRKMKKINDQANKWKRQSDKYEEALLMTNLWLKRKHEKKELEGYFIKNGYHTIAIYGMNYTGVRLYGELAETSVNISYGIDKYTSSSEVDIPVYSPEELPGPVDVVVVTPVYFYREIKSELEGYLDAPVVSLSDVLAELV